MADFLFPSANVISGSPVAVADLRSYEKITTTDVRSVRQHSEHTTPDQETENENTITTDAPGAVKYFLVFSSISGQPAQKWQLANSSDLDDEYDLVNVALGGS